MLSEDPGVGQSRGGWEGILGGGAGKDVELRRHHVPINSGFKNMLVAGVMYQESAPCQKDETSRKAVTLD